MAKDGFVLHQMWFLNAWIGYLQFSQSQKVSSMCVHIFRFFFKKYLE